jgi:hypothetical protein
LKGVKMKRCILRNVVCASLVAILAFPALAADHVILIGGLGGEAKYTDEFERGITAIRTSLVKHGYDAVRIHTLLEKAGPLKGGGDAAQSTLENIRLEFDRLRKESAAADTLLLVMVGHGQSDYQEPKFNLPGPDLTGHGLNELLNALPCRDQRMILVFPCSGHFSEILSQPTRTIVASTDGPRQIYHSIAIPYLLRALEKNDADANGDGKVSAAELFEFLSEQIKGHFEGAGSLATETPSLDDNGDGKVTARAQGMDAGDGERAAQVILLPAPGGAVSGGKASAEKPPSEKADKP